MKPVLTLKMAAPRGFCAGVDRAIKIVEKALEKFGTPVYVRHEIVHNKFVVETLQEKGAIFINELDEAPQGSTVIFSAHGAPKSVYTHADSLNMISIDATCPLVKKVHKEIQKFAAAGKHTILIGHPNHAEIIGTMGQVDPSTVTVVQNTQEAATVSVPDPSQVAYCTQTTLSIDQTRDVIAVLRSRFPNISSPNKADICYATTNRQDAVKTIAALVDAMIVIGSPNSSNSRQLAEVAKRSGCPQSLLLDRASELDWDWLGQPKSLGITAGASAPEILIDELINTLRQRFTLTIEQVQTAQENLSFPLPKILQTP